MNHTAPIPPFRGRLPVLLSLAALAAASLAGCTPESHDPTYPPGSVTTWTEVGPVAAGLDCNPLAPEWDCFYPYPSDFFTRPDATLPSGRRVEVPEAALPSFIDQPGEKVDFMQYHPPDGFSVLPQIAVRIPGGISTDALPFYARDPAASLVPSSPTLILDAETGEPVVHFAELNVRPEEIDDRALMIRPMRRLDHRRRYVVAIHGLKNLAGEPVQAPSGFRALRDGKVEVEGDDPGFRRRHALLRLQRYYDDRIFPALERFGVARADLQLAWDFTVESEEHVTGDMREVQRQILEAFEKAPPRVRVAEVRERTGTIAREVTGYVEVPLFTEDENGNRNVPGTLLRRGSDGKPAPSGTAEFIFIIRIPRVVLEESGPPARIVQYGHGFFGGPDEVRADSVSKFAHETRSVMMAIAWTGMAAADAAVVFGNLYSNPSKAMHFVDRVPQGMANFIALTYAAKGPLLEWESLRKDGAPIYDPEELYYYGISQGHILGGTYLALSPHIERATLNVGGAGFGLMMSRAKPFKEYLEVIDMKVGGPANAQKVVCLLQTMMDRIDPITYAPYLRTGTIPGSRPKKLLMQLGLGDAQVPNVASHVHARALGLPLLTPAVRSIWGIEEQPGPIADSALVEYDFGIPTPDLEARPVPHDNVVHGKVRELLSAIKQMDAFFRPNGQIVNFCGGGDGPCVAPGF